MSETEAVLAAVESAFHEAETIGAQRLTNYGGDLTGYYVPIEDWRRFRSHVKAEVVGALAAARERA